MNYKKRSKWFWKVNSVVLIFWFELKYIQTKIRASSIVSERKSIQLPQFYYKTCELVFLFLFSYLRLFLCSESHKVKEGEKPTILAFLMQLRLSDRDRKDGKVKESKEMALLHTNNHTSNVFLRDFELLIWLATMPPMTAKIAN